MVCPPCLSFHTLQTVLLVLFNTYFSNCLHFLHGEWGREGERERGRDYLHAASRPPKDWLKCIGTLFEGVITVDAIPKYHTSTPINYIF